MWIIRIGLIANFREKSWFVSVEPVADLKACQHADRSRCGTGVTHTAWMSGSAAPYTQAKIDDVKRILLLLDIGAARGKQGEKHKSNHGPKIHKNVTVVGPIFVPYAEQEEISVYVCSPPTFHPPAA